MSSATTRWNGSTKRRILHRAGLGTAGVLCMILPACGPTPEQKYEQKLASTGDPAIHAVANERLRQIMDELTYNPTPEDFEAASVRQEQMEKLAKAADKTEQSAKAVAALADQLQLSEADKAVFLKLAGKLASQGKDLGDAAKRGAYEQSRRELQRMQSTCNACHALFRTEPGMKKS